jgi:hypothetical protein
MKFKSKLLIIIAVLLIFGYGIYYGYMSLPLHWSSAFWRTPTTDLAKQV